MRLGRTREGSDEAAGVAVSAGEGEASPTPKSKAVVVMGRASLDTLAACDGAALRRSHGSGQNLRFAWVCFRVLSCFRVSLTL